MHFCVASSLHLIALYWFSERPGLHHRHWLQGSAGWDVQNIRVQDALVSLSSEEKRLYCLMGSLGLMHHCSNILRIYCFVFVFLSSCICCWNRYLRSSKPIGGQSTLAHWLLCCSHQMKHVWHARGVGVQHLMFCFGALVFCISETCTDIRKWRCRYACILLRFSLMTLYCHYISQLANGLISIGFYVWLIKKPVLKILVIIDVSMWQKLCIWN